MNSTKPANNFARYRKYLAKERLNLQRVMRALRKHNHRDNGDRLRRKKAHHEAEIKRVKAILFGSITVDISTS